jgi:hypothetical protein
MSTWKKYEFTATAWGTLKKSIQVTTEEGTAWGPQVLAVVELGKLCKAYGTDAEGNNVQGAGTAYNLTQGRHKIVFRYNSTTNVTKLFVDGAQRGASTAAAFASTIDRISVLGRINPFSSFSVDRQQFGGCNQFAIWKTVLTDAECIELSTL